MNRTITRSVIRLMGQNQQHQRRKVQNLTVNDIRLARLSTGPPPIPKTSPEDRILIHTHPSIGVGVVSMNKRPVNSLDLDYLHELIATIHDLENDKSYRGVIITSGMKKVFSGGIDIMEFYDRPAERLRALRRAVQDLWLLLLGSKLALVAAVNGHSPAGGCLIATACDYRVMAENYTIGFNEAKVGITAPFWFMDTMKYLIGARECDRAIQLGRLFRSEEALAVGLVDEVCSQDQVLPRALEQISQWLEVPDHSRQSSKLSLRGPMMERLLANRESDIKEFVDFILMGTTQKALGKFIENMTKKKK